MSSRVHQIALRIALLREEFTEKEIQSAVELLEEKGESSSLLDHFMGRKSTARSLRTIQTKVKPIEEQRSKAVLDIQQAEPEKYSLLSEFDSLLRKGSVLPEIEDINRLGKSLSKDFARRKSRREMVSKLMSLLVNRPIDEIRGIIESSLSTANVNTKDNDYQRLAQFIITGKSQKLTGQ